MCNVSLNGTQPTDASIRVLRALEAAGLEAWYVGGWVRDALMGRPSHDVDMCCSGLWQESKAALEDDLARRDFTVNAMAWHPQRGLVDRYDLIGRWCCERCGHERKYHRKCQQHRENSFFHCVSPFASIFYGKLSIAEESFAALR